MRIAMIGVRGIPARFGGSETCVEEISSRLVRMGHDVVVYCRAHNVPKELREYRGVRLVNLPSIPTLNFDTPSHTLFSSIHVILHNTADVVHLHGVGNGLFLPFLRLFGKKVVITIDGVDWARPKWGKAARLALRLGALLAVRGANEIITDSQIAWRLYHDEFHTDTEYVSYGAEIIADTGTEALEQYGLTDRNYILFTGALVPDKGVHLLKEAFEKVQTPMNLVIVGDSPFFPEYRAALKETQDTRIKFLGYVYGTAYKQLISHAYLYVQPSIVEGTSPALLAAMGAGNCVVVNGIRENRETIGDAGLAFSAGDTESLREILQRLVENPDEVASWRQRARQRVETAFNWDRISEQHVEIYQRALTGESRRRLVISERDS